MSIMAGVWQQAGMAIRLGTATLSESLYSYYQVGDRASEWERERERIVWASEISKPFPGDTSSLTRLYLLILHKQFHPGKRFGPQHPAAKHSNICAYGGSAAIPFFQTSNLNPLHLQNGWWTTDPWKADFLSLTLQVLQTTSLFLQSEGT